MTIVDILLIIVLVGLLFSLLNVIPLDARFKQLLYIVFVILLIVWILGLLGVVPGHRVFN